MGARILVVDDDPVVTRFLTTDLTLEGYEVDVLADGSLALDFAAHSLPDLVLLDVELPGLNGFEVLRQLRANPPTASLPVILLTGRSDPTDKVLGLRAGADDYVVKPFDTLELLARVGGTLRRTADIRALSPLTGLPGNHRIEVEIASRAASGQPYAVCHVDLDEFKGFNDAYGFQRGDQLLLLQAACLQRAVMRVGAPSAFLGHVGGDDFVVVCTPEQAEPLCRSAVEEFDAASVSCHDAMDAERGWLDVVDRRGEHRRQPLVSVSVGVASHHGGGDRDFRSVVAAATEMKTVAKSVPGSYVAVDRRH
ncbi:MAG: response regulator receiver modulated diguanylate cyclase [Frankiales bacterium]|nr:response regulator receiver modulated diguanylate cyclase [Frankiales bacterium]